MRFRDFHPHKTHVEQKSEVETQTQRRSRATVETQEKPVEQKTQQRSGIPLEWQRLAHFIEASRSIEPAKGYIESFWKRLLPRVNRLARQNELVREYLRETFWRRLSIRIAIAATMATMLYGIYSLSAQNRDLQHRLDKMQKEIQAIPTGK